MWAPVFVVVALLVLIQCIRVFTAGIRLRDDLQVLQNAIGTDDLTFGALSDAAVLQDPLERSIEDFQDLKGTLGPTIYLAPLFRWLPRYGGDLANAPALLDFGESLTESALDTVLIGQSLDSEMRAGRAAGRPIGVSIFRVAQAQPNLLREANDHLAQMVSARGEIDVQALTPSFSNMIERADTITAFWRAGLETLANASTLFGADRPRLYLFVAQNSDELRATGGFVSAVALVKVEQGNLTISEFQDSFAVDDLTKRHPSPPEPLWKYMSATQWMFRDANWSPDFAESARQLETIYQLDRNVAVDGVIAVNLKAVPRLVEAVGPLIPEGTNETINASNVISKIQSYWTAPQGQGLEGDWWAHRKDFIGPLMQTLLKRMLAGDVDQAKLGKAIMDVSRSKDLLIYVNDEEGDVHSGILNGGTVYRGPGDALLVVDSNVGFNKVDVMVDRHIGYSVNVDSSGSAQATITITYTNKSSATSAFCVHQPIYTTQYAEMQKGCYWDYVRVLAPEGSELVRASGDLEAATAHGEEGRTTFGGYLVLPRGETRTIFFEYHLPPLDEDESSYSLRVERQPGASAVPVAIRLSFPKEWGVTSTAPVASWQNGNSVGFNLTIDRDKDVRVTFSRPPAISWGFVAGILSIALAVMGVFWIPRRLTREGKHA